MDGGDGAAGGGGAGGVEVTQILGLVGGVIVLFVVVWALLAAMRVRKWWEPVAVSADIPPVTDPKLVRDRFKLEKVAAMDRVDVIVVGSGIGSLTTAALLARTGNRVLVLEQHDRAGGCTHEWSDKGFDWDVGVHYIGGRVWKASDTRALFDAVTGGEVEWVKVEGAYDIAVLAGGGPARAADADAVATGEGGVEWHSGGHGPAAFVGGEKDTVVPMPPGRAALMDRLRQVGGAKYGPCVDKWVAEIRKAQSLARGYFGSRILPRWLLPLAESLQAPWIRECGEVTVAEMLDQVGLGKPPKWMAPETPAEEAARLRLRFALSYMAGDYGVWPEEAPFGIHASVANHYFEGAAFPKGGAEALARGAARTIRAHGGRVLVGAHVKSLLVEGGRCTGVRVAVGDKEHNIRAPRVVSGIGAPLTFSAPFMPAETASRLAKEYPMVARITAAAGGDAMPAALAPPTPTEAPEGAMRASVAHFQLFLGFDDSVKTEDLSQGNYWVFLQHPDRVAAAGGLAPGAAGEGGAAGGGGAAGARDVGLPDSIPPELREALADLPFDLWGAFISFPAAKSQAGRRPTAAVIAEAPWEHFAEWRDSRLHKRGEAYDALKAKVTRALQALFLTHFPGLKDKIKVVDLGTPVSAQHYLFTPQGSSYGLAHGRDRFSAEAAAILRPESPVPGLYLTGQDVLMAGVAGAGMGGVFTAVAMNPVDVIGRFGATLGLWRDPVGPKQKEN